jgi:hypothetical protein
LPPTDIYQLPAALFQACRFCIFGKTCLLL